MVFVHLLLFLLLPLLLLLFLLLFYLLPLLLLLFLLLPLLLLLLLLVFKSKICKKAAEKHYGQFPLLLSISLWVNGHGRR